MSANQANLDTITNPKLLQKLSFRMERCRKRLKMSKGEFADFLGLPHGTLLTYLPSPSGAPPRRMKRLDRGKYESLWAKTARNGAKVKESLPVESSSA